MFSDLHRREGKPGNDADFDASDPLCRNAKRFQEAVEGTECVSERLEHSPRIIFLETVEDGCHEYKNAHANDHAGYSRRTEHV